MLLVYHWTLELENILYETSWKKLRLKRMLKVDDVGLL
jgi:hypothetical protein